MFVITELSFSIFRLCFMHGSQLDVQFTAPHHPKCPPFLSFTTGTVKMINFQTSTVLVPSPSDRCLSVFVGSRKSYAGEVEACIFFCSPCESVAQQGCRQQQGRIHLAQPLFLAWRRHPAFAMGRLPGNHCSLSCQSLLGLPENAGGCYSCLLGS